MVSLMRFVRRLAVKESKVGKGGRESRRGTTLIWTGIVDRVSSKSCSVVALRLLGIIVVVRGLDHEIPPLVK